MAEPNSLQILSRVSTEVEESQTKLNLITLCIKAQQDLACKLRKESQRRKEICNFVRNSNLQLETEIRNADQDIKSMLAAYESIKSANVELKKELLLSKENNLELIEDMKKGEKKYEDLWLQSKKRYESIPFVQNWLQAINKMETLKGKINILENETKVFYKDIKIKKEILVDLDKKRIIRLAEFFVYKMPDNLKIIKEKSDEIRKLTIDIGAIIKEQEIANSKVSKLGQPVSKVDLPPPSDNSNNKMIDDNWPNLSKNINESLVMPRLEFANAQIDVLNVKLELNKVVMYETTPVKRSDSVSELEENAIKRSKKEDKLDTDFISSYFNKPFGLDTSDAPRDSTENYSRRKLINILEDITLDENETFNIISKVNPVKLQEIDAISADTFKSSKTIDFTETPKIRVCTPLESEEIEEIDLTKSRTQNQNILIPPSPFLDLSQENVLRSTQREVEVIVHLSMEDVPSQSLPVETKSQLKSSQENVKKRVSFDVPMNVEEVSKIDTSKTDAVNETGETLNNQLEENNMSLVTDDNFMQIKDMILKKHNLEDLDLSPQFVYAKKTAPQKINEDGKVVTSKFFNQENQIAFDSVQIMSEENKQTKAKVIEIDDNSMDHSIIQNEQRSMVIEEDKAIASSKTNVAANPVAGLLHNHGPQGIPESLDVSMSTTGFEDGDVDFPHCLDSSLLLSPKADLQPMNGNNTDGGSQEVPNFLSGFRKTGLFFFGQSRQAETKPESSASSQEQKFNFNFGGQENKTRGGLFNFFR